MARTRSIMQRAYLERQSSTQTNPNVSQHYRNSPIEEVESAKYYANLAKEWATNPEDVEVQDGLYSAYHWAQKAEGSSDVLENMEATAITLQPEEPAFADWDKVTGTMSFGIPKGEKGDAGAGFFLEGKKPLTEILNIEDPYVGEAWGSTTDGSPATPGYEQVQAGDLLFYSNNDGWLVLNLTFDLDNEIEFGNNLIIPKGKSLKARLDSLDDFSPNGVSDLIQIDANDDIVIGDWMNTGTGAGAKDLYLMLNELKSPSVHISYQYQNPDKTHLIYHEGYVGTGTTELALKDYVDLIKTDVDNLNAKAVLTDTEQTITGVKTFTNGIVTNNISQTTTDTQGLTLFGGGSTRLGGSGSVAGIQIRPNGLDPTNVDSDYFSFQPEGVFKYKGTSNMVVSRDNGTQGMFAYQDGRTFLTGDNGYVEIRPKGLSDSSRRLVVQENGSVLQEHSGSAAYTFQDSVNSGTNSSSFFQWTHKDAVRRGYIGYGSSANNNLVVWNDDGGNYISLRDDGNVQLDAGAGDSIILSGTSISDKYQASGARGGSWGHSINPALTLTGTNSDFAYNVFQMGDTGAKMQALGEGGDVVRLYPGGGSSNFTYWTPKTFEQYYTGTDAMTWLMYANAINTKTVLSYRENAGKQGFDAGYDGSSPNNEYFINVVDTDGAGAQRAFSIFRNRQRAILNTNEVAIESSGGQKLRLYRDDSDANVNIQFTSATGASVWAGKTAGSFAIGNAADLSTETNQFMRINGSGAIYRVPVYLPTGIDPTTADMAARKAYVDLVASDSRIKSDIEAVEDALSLVNKIPVYSYYKDVVEYDENRMDNVVNKKFEYGFLAQDIKEFLPHLVTEREDGVMCILRTGNDLVALAYNAIQGLSKKVNTLEQENNDLKSRLEAIENHLFKTTKD